jgi:O-antigen/teichoic acid export membrane protein
MSTSQRILKNTGFLYIRMGITVLISLYTTRLILNSLGASDFGIFAVVGGAIGMLSFLDGAMSTATQRFMSYAEGEGNIIKKIKVFNVSIVLHFVISIIVLLLLEGAYFIFFNGILNITSDRIFAAKTIYQFMILSSFFTILTVPFDATINSHENMLFYGITGVLESVLKLILAIWLTYTQSDKLIQYGLFITLIIIFILIIKFIYCKIKYEECKFNKKHFDKSLFKEMLNFAGWNFISSSGTLVGNYGSNLVVNYYFGTVVNAAQGIVGQLNGQLLAFSNNMLKAINPVIVKKEGGGNRDSMMKITITGSKLSYVLLAIFAIPFLLESSYILKLWLKQVPLWTLSFSRLFLITTLIQQLTITFNTTIGATGKIKVISTFNAMISLVPNIFYIIIFSNGGSPIWLYVLILINLGIINGIFITYQCKKQCGLDIYLFIKKVIITNLYTTLSTLAIGFLIIYFQKESFLRLMEVVILCPILFLILTYIFTLDIDEKNIIKSLKSKFIKN